MRGAANARPARQVLCRLSEFLLGVGHNRSAVLQFGLCLELLASASPSSFVVQYILVLSRWANELEEEGTIHYTTLH